MRTAWKIAVTMACLFVIGLCLAAPVACVINSIEREKHEQEWKEQQEKEIKEWREKMKAEKRHRAWVNSEMERIERERR